MARRVQQLNVGQLEESLCGLKDVYAAKVMLTDAGDEVEEIHLIASQARNPKQIVRDVESLLFVRFHTRIDYRRVSLVQLSAEDLPSYFRRPKLLSVKQDTSNGGLRVEVSLVHADGVEIVGKAQAQSEAPDGCHVAASATMQAVAGLISNPDTLKLQRAQVTSLNGHTVALVHLTWQSAHGLEHLLGATLAEPDVVHGAVRATLDAVNRKFF
jgi:hypothetical protein